VTVNGSVPVQILEAVTTFLKQKHTGTFEIVVSYCELAKGDDWEVRGSCVVPESSWPGGTVEDTADMFRFSGTVRTKSWRSGDGELEVDLELTRDSEPT
jgi:hypothetical protein